MTIKQLNELTDAGLISDNAVTWSDVAPCDQERALAWLEQRRIDSLKAQQRTPPLEKTSAQKSPNSIDALLKSE